MASDPLVDIILPVRDRARYIALSIRSIQRQTFSSWRLLVLDDGSVDETGSIVEAMAREDPRLCLVRLPANGIVSTLNAGLRHARAPLVARQDSDDISLPHRLDYQVRYLQDHPDCAALSGGVYRTDQDGNRVDRGFSPPGQGHENAFWVPALAPYLMSNILLARREALLSVNGYRHFINAEGVDLCWRLAETQQIVSSPEILGEYRVHEGSVSNLSVVNARLHALMWHLAAVAARRRRAASGDLDIQPAMPERLVRAETLEGMTELFRDELDRDELHYVLCGSVMRLLGNFLFRPFRLEASDVRLAARAWQDLPPCTPTNRRELAVLIGHVVRRLRTNLRPDLARELAPEGSSLLHHLGVHHRGPRRAATLKAEPDEIA